MLIADDSSLTRKTLKELLQAHGWGVCGEAENGRDGGRMAVELKPDAVILDLAMPLYGRPDSSARDLFVVSPGSPS